MFQYFQKHGVTFNYDITKTNAPIPKPTLANNPLVGNVYVIKGVEYYLPQTDHDIVLFFFDYSNWKAPWYWPYPLWGNVPRDCTYMANGKPFITIGYWPTDNTVAQRFIHEPMHSLAKIFGCQDVMDSYDQDSDIWNTTGNFGKQWAIFQSYMNPTTPLQSPKLPQDTSLSPTAVLTRLNDNGVETRGKLVVTYGDKTFSCDTLERPWKNNQTNISCIPTGTYHCSMQPFHNTKHYELSPTAPRTGIFIHPLNYMTQTEGCIGLGNSYSDINHDGQLDVLHSVDTITAFEKFLDGVDFSLQIVNSPSGS